MSETPDQFHDNPDGVAGTGDAVGLLGRVIDGLTVLADEPVVSPLPPPSSGRPPAMIRDLRLLTLSDGSQIYACERCPQVVGTRTQVLRHRRQTHGRAVVTAAVGDPDHVSAYTVAPSIAALTLGEILELAAAANQWGEMFAHQNQRLEHWRERALDAERWRTKVVRRLEQVGFRLAELEDEDVDAQNP